MSTFASIEMYCHNLQQRTSNPLAARWRDCRLSLSLFHSPGPEVGGASSIGFIEAIWPHFAAVTLCRGIAVHGITADRAREQGDLIAGYRVTATAALIGTLLSLFIVENSSGTPLLSLTLASRRPGLSLERCGFMSIVKLQRVFTVRTDIQWYSLVSLL